MSDKLAGWRKQIDDIDEKIITYLAKRIEIVRKIGKFKKKHSISTFDEGRWSQVLESNLIKGEKLRLSKDLIKKFYSLVHKHSIKVQKEHI